MNKFRIVQSPEPTKVSNRKSCRIITDVTDLIGSSVVIYASTRVLLGEVPEEIVEENESEFILPSRWRVNMAYPCDRAGIQQFKSVPLDILTSFWNKPVNVSDSGLQAVGSGIFRFTDEEYFGGTNLTCFFLWPEMGSFPAGPVIGTSKPDETVAKTLKWLYDYSPEIIPFTDSDSMFLDAQTEVAYISDLMG